MTALRVYKQHTRLSCRLTMLARVSWGFILGTLLLYSSNRKSNELLSTTAFHAYE